MEHSYLKGTSYGSWNCNPSRSFGTRGRRLSSIAAIPRRSCRAACLAWTALAPCSVSPNCDNESRLHLLTLWSAPGWAGQEPHCTWSNATYDDGRICSGCSHLSQHAEALIMCNSGHSMCRLCLQSARAGWGKRGTPGSTHLHAENMYCRGLRLCKIRA